MTILDLDALKAAYLDTTPYKWVVAEEIDGWRAGRMTVVKAGDRRVVTVDQTRPHHDGGAEANIAFIVAAHEAFPALLAEIERLRERRGYASQALDKARGAAEQLLKKEQRHNGSGRDGHLNEADLVPLFEALGAVYLDQPDPQVFVSSDGDPE